MQKKKILLDCTSLRAEDMASLIYSSLMPKRGQSTYSVHIEGGGDGYLTEVVMREGIILYFS